MKKIIIVLLALSPIFLKGQNPNRPNNNEAPPAINTSKEPMYLVDGKETPKSKALSIPKEEVLENKVMSGADASKLYGDKGSMGVISMVTRKYAIKAYQEMFSTFSDDLESYLTGHGTDDTQFVYVLNGVPLAKDKDETGKLYHLAKENIQSVTLTQSEPEGSKVLGRIIIKTKN